MGNLSSCVSCQSKTKDQYTVNQVGDYKGAGHNDASAASAAPGAPVDSSERKLSVEHMHLQIQPDSSIRDISSVHLRTEPSGGSSQSTQPESGSHISALDLYNVIRSNQRMKVRRATPVYTPTAPQRILPKPDAALASALNELGEEEEEEDEDDEVGEEEEEEELPDDSEMDDIEKAAQAIVDMSLFLTTKVIYPAYMRYLEEDHPELYAQYTAAAQHSQDKLTSNDVGILSDRQQAIEHKDYCPG